MEIILQILKLLKNYQVIQQLVIIDILQLVKHHLRNIQPFFADLYHGGLSIAHNGNLTNAITLRNDLVKNGSIFRTTSDTETIVQLIAQSKREKILDKITEALFKIQGGYALVILTNKKLIGIRDPFRY